MAMCAGVQKVSRPIDSCQEISHTAPTIAEVTAAEAHQRYQGKPDRRSASTSDPLATRPAAMVATTTSNPYLTAIPLERSVASSASAFSAPAGVSSCLKIANVG